MPEKSTMYDSIWQKIWRSTPLTRKALFASTLLGVFFWIGMDFWQTRQVKSILQRHLREEINTQAKQNRTRLDNYFRTQEESAKLFAYLMPFVDYVRDMEIPWSNDPTLSRQWLLEQRPPWLPPRSVMHGIMAYAPYILLLDAQQHIRESFYRDEGLPPVSAHLKNTLSKFISLKSQNHIVKEPEGKTYLITSSALLDAKKVAKAFLVFIAPMDDDFLAIFRSGSKKSGMVVFINSQTDRVFASSRPDRIASGSVLADIQDRYLVVGKNFLDHSFAGNILINFATLIPHKDLYDVSSAILSAERKQRAFGYATLAALFLAVVFSVARSLQRFTQKMVDISVHQLGLRPKIVMAGDQLLMMQEQFHLMTDEILQSRQREKERRAEMQSTNDALHKSLVIIKRTQSQLVESEKMASLGGLVAGVAHEINTPIGTGVTAASFLESKSQDCAKQLAKGQLRKSELDSFLLDVIESTQMILSNLLRAAELIRSFKQVAVDRTHEERRSFRLEEYIHHILLSLRPRLKKTKVSVTVQCDKTLEINSYPGAFSQIITNLVINSLVHGFQADASGIILFQVTVEEGDICFHYSDDGQGMEEESRVRIFEPFFTTTRSQGGSGLGMHIVFNLVTQTLKGRIRCISAPGQGTAYEIRIPPEQSGS